MIEKRVLDKLNWYELKEKQLSADTMRDFVEAILSEQYAGNREMKEQLITKIIEQAYQSGSAAGKSSCDTSWSNVR